MYHFKTLETFVLNLRIFSVFLLEVAYPYLPIHAHFME